MSTSFGTYGDCGDTIYLCPSMRLKGSVTLYARDGLRPHDPFTARLPLIAPLLEAQDYIEAVLPWNGEQIDHDASFFRDAGHPFGVTLASLQAEWLGLTPNLHSPWLTVTPDPWTPIVINRTTRYRNHFFPWDALVATFGKEMLFLGHPYEYEDFCRDFGRIGYLPTANLLKAAEVIAGSELFIGNQSSCYAIAEALKHNSIQETDLSTPDCIYVRPNAIHCHDGALDFTACGKHFTSKNRLFVRAHPNETPPGGWSATVGAHKANSYAFDLTLREITTKLRKAGMDVPPDLKEMIIEQNSLLHLDHPVARLKAHLHTA
jgi:hypothetical protein